MSQIKAGLTSTFQALISQIKAKTMLKGVDYVTAGKANNTTLGNSATAEGANNTVSGQQAHGEGYGNTASGTYAHVEGNGNIASHTASHAEGVGTKTGAQNQHVGGKFNVGKETTLFEIGKGTANNARSNAFEISTEGNVVAAGTITDGSGNVLSNKADSSSLGTAAAKNIPASGNAGITEVVMGDDTRLTNSRPASDVPSWAKESTKPAYTYSEVGAAAASHTHNYAGSSSAGGAATSADTVYVNGPNANGAVYAQTTDPGAGSSLTTGRIVLVYNS